jgi:hypothetical protein
LTKVVDCWDIIARLRYDKSYWHHLEPAEITEIIQRIKEGKKEIHGLDKFIKLELKPALRKLKRMRNHLHIRNSYNLNMQKVSSF